MSYISGNGTLHFSLQAGKIKEIHPWKISYASGNRNPEKISYILLGFGKKEKSFYISGGNLQSMKIKKKLFFSKLKYFFIIIIKRFFSFYNIFFYTQQAFVFHFLRDFFNIHDQIVAFFLSLL